MHWSKDHPDYICAMSTAISTPSSRKKGFSTSCPSTMPERKRKSDDLSPAEKAIAPKRTVATLLNPFPALGPETDEPWFTQIHETVQGHARFENAGDMSKKILPLDVSWQPQPHCVVSLIFHLQSTRHYVKPVSQNSVSPPNFTARGIQTATEQQSALPDFRKAAKLLHKLDSLSIATSKLHTTIVDIEKVTQDIDAMMKVETTSFPLVVTQLRETCQDLIKGYEERLAVMIRWSGETVDG